jgi:hypothetical protein
MSLPLTNEQWAELQASGELPVRVSDPNHEQEFVLLRAEVYERFKSLFEADPVSEQERLFHLQQFGRRAGWDDPEMDVYNDLDPRRP